MTSAYPYVDSEALILVGLLSLLGFGVWLFCWLVRIGLRYVERIKRVRRDDVFYLR